MNSFKKSTGRRLKHEKCAFLPQKMDKTLMSIGNFAIDTSFDIQFSQWLQISNIMSMNASL